MIAAKAIKPHSTLTASVFQNAIRKEGESIGKEIKKDFEKTTRTWKNKPLFIARTFNNAEGISVEVSTTNEVYGYVDKGTKPHIIRPRRAKRLNFSSKFKPKTKPHVIGSTAGMQGKRDVFAKVVHHPGNEAREFSRDIQAAWQPKLKTRIERVITQTAQRTSR